MHGREAVSLRWLLLYVWAMGHAVLRHGRTAVSLNPFGIVLVRATSFAVLHAWTRGCEPEVVVVVVACLGHEPCGA